MVKHLVDNPPILRQVLLYHVVGGAWFSAGLEDGMQVDTLQKSQLTINVQNGMPQHLPIQFHVDSLYLSIEVFSSFQFLH